MITKGIIKSIDYNGNTCIVRIPIFESSATDTETTFEAIFSITPGMYNGYLENDVVLVSFEDNTYDKPIVLGKLYLGAAAENQSPRGALNCNSFNASKNMTVPFDTKLINEVGDKTTASVENGLNTYTSLIDIAKGLNEQKTAIGAVNVKIIDDGERLGSMVTKLAEDGTRYNTEILQNADEIKLVAKKEEEFEGETIERESQIKVYAEGVNAEAKKKLYSSSTSIPGKIDELEESFGWNLTADDWSVYRNMSVNGAPSADNVWFSTILSYEKEEAGTYFFTDIRDLQWSGDNDEDAYIYVHMWKAGSALPEGNPGWPGYKITKFKKNAYGERVFEIPINTLIYDHIKVNCGPGHGNYNDKHNKTADIFVDALITDNAWYPKYQELTDDGYNVGTWLNPQEGTDSKNYVAYIAINGRKTGRYASSAPVGTDGQPDVHKLKVKVVDHGEGHDPRYTWSWDEEGSPYDNMPTSLEADVTRRVLTVDKDGLMVHGRIEANEGNIGAFEIGD